MRQRRLKSCCDGLAYGRCDGGVHAKQIWPLRNAMMVRRYVSDGGDTVVSVGAIHSRRRVVVRRTQMQLWWPFSVLR
ncbi:hypothetical protein HanIR_Chr13g0636711 [Helianthus annuus]|nr:hypothetical protein HanIR_Chr13g0636711 [Helianthus annuus]